MNFRWPVIAALACSLAGCPKPGTPVDAGQRYVIDTHDGGLCADTWEAFGQNFFVTNCTGCHVHDHANLAALAAVQNELGLINSKAGSGEMPQDATLDPDEKQRLLLFIACGAPGAQSDLGVPFEAETAAVAVAKVKMLLVGLAPSDEEVRAVALDHKALEGLVAGWMQLPQYTQKMKVFFELAFQQTQITQVDFVDLIPANGLGVGQGVPLLVPNLRESFARTVLELIAEGRPLTDAFTTHRLMMTPALMELYAFMDARTVDNGGKITDAVASATQNITIEKTAGPIPIEQTVDPASPNYMHWYDPDVGSLGFVDPTCNADPIVMPVAAYSVHYLLYGAVAARTIGIKNCLPKSGTAAAIQMAPTDFTA